MPPVVSVVIPMLDARVQVDALISSLFAQDFDAPWEIIAVDNGSTDDTVNVVRSLFAADPPENIVRTQIVQVPSPQGYATPRNAGVRNSTAPLLAFCDADGAVEEHWLTAIVEALQHHPLVASHKVHSSDVHTRTPDAVWYEQHKLLTMLGFPFAQTGGLGCTRALFDALGGFDTYFDLGGEDVDFSMRARFELGIEPVLEQSAIYWTKTPRRVMKAFSKGFRDGRSRVRLFQRHRDRHGEPPSGMLVWLRRAVGVVWRILRLHRGSHMQKMALAQQVGSLFGRAVWSVKLRVRYF